MSIYPYISIFFYICASLPTNSHRLPRTFGICRAWAGLMRVQAIGSGEWINQRGLRPTDLVVSGWLVDGCWLRKWIIFQPGRVSNMFATFFLYLFLKVDFCLVHFRYTRSTFVDTYKEILTDLEVKTLIRPWGCWLGPSQTDHWYLVDGCWCGFLFFLGGGGTRTLPETKSSPLKIGRIPKGNVIFEPLILQWQTC